MNPPSQPPRMSPAPRSAVDRRVGMARRAVPVAERSVRRRNESGPSHGSPRSFRPLSRSAAFMPLHRPKAQRPTESPAPVRTLKRTEVRAPNAVGRQVGMARRAVPVAERSARRRNEPPPTHSPPRTFHPRSHGQGWRAAPSPSPSAASGDGTNHSPLTIHPARSARVRGARHLCRFTGRKPKSQPNRQHPFGR